jgi:hypothetical protein
MKKAIEAYKLTGIVLMVNPFLPGKIAAGLFAVIVNIRFHGTGHADSITYISNYFTPSGFNNIIDIGGYTGFGVNRIRFINITGLFLREPAAFNPVGVVAKFYLGKMVNSSFKPHLSFFPQPVQ